MWRVGFLPTRVGVDDVADDVLYRRSGLVTFIEGEGGKFTMRTVLRLF